MKGLDETLRREQEEGKHYWDEIQRSGTGATLSVESFDYTQLTFPHVHSFFYCKRAFSASESVGPHKTDSTSLIVSLAGAIASRARDAGDNPNSLQNPFTCAQATLEIITAGCFLARPTPNFRFPRK